MAQMLTAKQVAEVKGCSPRYIKKIIQDLLPGKSILQRNTVRESQESLLDCLFPEAVPFMF